MCSPGVLRGRRAAAAEGAPAPWRGGAPHFLATQMLGIAPGLKKLIGKCSQMPSYRAHNVQLVSVRALWHVSKTVARVCMFSLPIMRSPGMCQQVNAQTLPAPNKIHMLLVVLCLPCFHGVKCRTVLNSSASFLQQVKMCNRKA